MDQYIKAVQDSVAQNNEWSAQQAAKQMEFQERLSNTAHQREIDDLKAAGLNPVLSARLGGASTPSGSAASGDTSGTAAIVELMKMSLETANTAAKAAQQAAASSRGSGNVSQTSVPSDNSASGNYRMSQADAEKVYSMLGDGSRAKSIFEAAADAVGNAVGKVAGRDAGRSVSKAIKNIPIEFDPVKRGEATVNRINQNALTTQRIVDSIGSSARKLNNSITAAVSKMKKNMTGHSHSSGRF